MGTKQLNGFEKYDPFRRAFNAETKYKQAIEHYKLFPYESVFDYGATDLLKKWYDIMGEILGEETESHSSGIEEV